MPCIVHLGWNHYPGALILGFVSWTVIHVRLSDNRGVVEVLFYLRFFDRCGKVLKLKEPKESGEFVTDFSRKMLQKNRRIVEKTFHWNAMRYGPKTPGRGHSSSALCLFWHAHPRSRLFIEQSTWRGWAIESSQNSHNRNWNGTGALIKWSKTKPNGCVCFFCRVWHVATKKIGFIADYWFLPSQGWYFKTSHWCKNDRSIRKRMFGTLLLADGLSYDHERRLLDCRPHQFPSSINECSFQKNEGPNCWNKANRFPIVVKPYSKQKMVKFIANCCCEFHSRPFAALPQTIKPQISGVSCRMQKRLLFLHAHWCCFFCSTSCYK